MKNSIPTPLILHCKEPGCGRLMRYSHPALSQDVYVCMNKHIRKVAKSGGQRIAVQNPPKGAA